MVTFPNAKINLGLNVLSQRRDGFHEISSVFVPVPVCDALEIISSPSSEKDEFSFSGLKVDGALHQNLCHKALTLIRQDYSIPPLQVHLHKNIPMGAGLGGGSSDGAFTLTLLNSIFKLEISPQEIKSMAERLGSDCPFFIENTAAAVSGRGDILTKIELDLSRYFIAIVFAEAHISTALAYQHVRPKHPAMLPEEVVLTHPIEEWKDLLNNDFEPLAFRQYPELEKTKDRLYTCGALFASMTGSGSAIYGLFDHKPDLQATELASAAGWIGHL